MALSYLVDRRNVFTSPWTAERDATLVQMWADGYSASQIAKQLEDAVSRCAVIGRAHRLKLPPRAARQKARKRERKPRMFVPKPPAPPRQPQPPPPPNEPKMRRVPLLKLRAHDCRWPLGDGPFLFCSTDVAEGRAYCPYHCARAYIRSGR